MGVLDKFLDAIKLNDDFDDDDLLDDEDFGEEDDEFLEEEENRSSKSRFWNRFGKQKSSGDVSDEELIEDFDEEEPEAAKPAGRSVFSAQKEEKAPRSASPIRSSKITPMRPGRRSGNSGHVEVCVIRPTSMENTREIADTLLDNSTVILNLEGLDIELAQRIIDFTSGSCYSLGGTLQKVSSYIFVLGPSSVDITGDLQNILGGSMPSVRAGY